MQSVRIYLNILYFVKLVVLKLCIPNNPKRHQNQLNPPKYIFGWILRDMCYNYYSADMSEYFRRYIKKEHYPNHP